MRAVAIDFETYYDNACNIKRLGPDRYCASPEWEAYLVSVNDGETSWVGHPKDLNWAALDGARLLAHNSYFEETVCTQLRAGGMDAPRAGANWSCTSNLSAYLCNRRSLADAVKYFYKEDLSKDMRAWAKGKRWADIVAAGRADEMKEYARRDAYWCHKLWTDHSSKWPAHEQELARITTDSGRYGVAIDRPLLDTYLEAARKELFAVDQRLPWIERGRAPTSPTGVAEECDKAGIPHPPVASHDPDGFAAWEAQYAPLHEWIAAVASRRSVNKVLGTLETIRNRMRPDGTVEAPLKYFGAHTGRWSGDSGLNWQNLRSKPLLCAGVGIDIRRLVIPRPGKILIVADLAQIEPRVLAWLGGNTAMLNLVRQGMSVYEAHARLAMGWEGSGSLKQLDPDLYKFAKIQVLGLGYGCGWRKFTTIARDLEGIELKEADARHLVNTFRDENPRITGLWEKLETAFRNSLTQDLEVELPSQRKMRYESVHRSRRLSEEIDEITGKKTVTSKLVYTAMVSGFRRALYGGLLTENLVQAVARDVFADGLLRLHAAGRQILFTCHDEVVIEANSGDSCEEIRRLLSETPAWLPGCPIDAEVAAMPFYRK